LTERVREALLLIDRDDRIADPGPEIGVLRLKGLRHLLDATASNDRKCNRNNKQYPTHSAASAPQHAGFKTTCTPQSVSINLSKNTT
jgi:hypothetical protein